MSPNRRRSLARRVIWALAAVALLAGSSQVAFAYFV